MKPSPSVGGGGGPPAPASNKTPLFDFDFDYILMNFMEDQVDVIRQSHKDLISEFSIVILIYLDDVLVLGNNAQAVLTITKAIRSHLADLGFFLDLDKNPMQMHPHTFVEWLGKQWCSSGHAIQIYPTVEYLQNTAAALCCLGANTQSFAMPSLIGSLVWLASPAMLALPFFQPLMALPSIEPGERLTSAVICALKGVAVAAWGADASPPAPLIFWRPDVHQLLFNMQKVVPAATFY